MPPIKIACSGYPVRQKTYQARLNAVELSQMFEGMPRATTIDRWKAEARAGFEFIACAPDAITHPRKDPDPRSHRYGFFQDTAEVHAAYRGAAATAEALGAHTMLFRLARNAGPNPDQVDRLHRFFSKVDRGRLHFVWEPPASWPLSLVTSVSKALRLFPVFNPLAEKPMHPGPLRYFRLGARGHTAGVHRFTDEELGRLKRITSEGPSYVVFNNGPYAFEDAVRFAAMIY
jgi:uncharacterized protein YecE (DUF72 family)